jgi:UDP-N-acetylmuramate dehydrogenase
MVDIAAADCGFAYRDSMFKQNAGRYLIASVTFKLPRPWQAVTTYAELAKQYAGNADETLPQATPQAVANAVIAIRQRKLPDPAQIANAGSFFKNPVVSTEQAAALKALHPLLPTYPQPLGSSKLAAGWLIEQAGWKGYTRRTGSGGQVGVHAAQALVLVHLGCAQGAELLQLASDIQADVFNKFGVQLEREVNVW